MLDGNKFES